MVPTMRVLPAFLILVLIAGGCSRQPAVLTHTVGRGETLAAIARRYQVDVATIVDANGLPRTSLEPGTVLRIPGGIDLGPPPEPVAEIVPAPLKPKPGTMRYRPRQAWGAPPVSNHLADPMGRIFRLTVHHTGLDEHQHANGRELLARIANQHRSRGWAAIGYHFVIDGEGHLWEGRPLAYQGAHAGGDNNIGNIGVVVAGDFSHHPPSPAQLAALDYCVDTLCQHFHIPLNQVVGHRDLKATDCPGEALGRRLDAYRAGGSFAGD